FRILCRSDFRGKAMRALSRFIVTDDVEVRELPGSAVGVIGPLSSQRLSRAWQALPQKPFAQAEASLEGRPVLLVRDTRFGLDGYQLWVGPDCKAFCADWIAQHCDCAAVDSEVLEILRIEAGIPTAGVDYDESNLPLECNLEHALNFTKGCYTGQEIIARVTYRASVSRKLMGLLVKQDTIPTPGEEILFQNRVIGRVTSAVQSPRLGGPIALAYIEKEFLSVSEVELKSSGTGAEMRPLPLAPPNL
ncbi:MAG: hypothetical protein HY315_01625, partial [Acidobacteria bacterium]|nr:hypothetical protein [Acidobacteriota bacterium]